MDSDFNDDNDGQRENSSGNRSRVPRPTRGIF